jgi:hypothetical protein
VKEKRKKEKETNLSGTVQRAWVLEKKGDKTPLAFVSERGWDLTPCVPVRKGEQSA